MPSDHLELPAVEGPPTTKTVAVKTAKGKVLTIGWKLKRLIDKMTWDGLEWSEAAREVGFNGRSARRALEKPHVQRYLRGQRAAFRAALSARNETVLGEVRDKVDGNQMARVAAVRALDQLAEPSHDVPGRAITPGVVVNVNLDRREVEVDDTIIEVYPGQSSALPVDRGG